MAARGAPDEVLLARLAGIERAAAAVHDAVAATGLLDATAVALVTSFAEHHRAHAAAYEAELGSAAPIDPDPEASESLFAPVFGAIDAATLLAGARAVEAAMAATAIDAGGQGDDRDVAGLIARVAAVEARHLAVLGVAVGAAPDDLGPADDPADRSLLGG